MAAHTTVSTTRGLLLFGFLFAALASILYSPVLDAPFLYDDFEIIGDPLLQVDSLPELLRLLTAEGVPRKIGKTSFALNLYASGSEPRAFHLVNIAIHAINVPET